MDRNCADYLHILGHGYFRVAVMIPEVALADPMKNCDRHVALIETVAEKGALYILFPELSLSGYSIDDYAQQDVLLNNCRVWLDTLLRKTTDIGAIITLGMPIVFDQRLFNCAVTVCKGEILSVVPKSYLPNYREFYEKRHYVRAIDARSREVNLCDQHAIPFGNDVILRLRRFPDVAIHVEICEDIWVPVPPSSLAALAGATILANASASNITVAKSEYRHALVSSHSAKTLAACLYTSAGCGESTNDLAWDGQGFIYERGELTAETERFVQGSTYAIVDVDISAIVQDRMRQNSFADNATDILRKIGETGSTQFRFVDVEYFASACEKSAYHVLHHEYSASPYVPRDVTLRDKRCMEIFNMQTSALARRLKALPPKMRKIIIGVSGGRDSTHALIIAARALDMLTLPRTDIIAVTMPGLGTGGDTLLYALRLMKSFGVTHSMHPIADQVFNAFESVGHDLLNKDSAYENMQAMMRTSHLFSLAWEKGGIVLGTGDLSEAMVGWCTYGIGDHMSHYGINIGVPKTLIEYLIKWAADTQFAHEPEIVDVLEEVLSTTVSPELVPPDVDGSIQSTDEIIGPADLRDFFMYYFLRFGFSPYRLCRMAYEVFGRKRYVGSDGALHEPYELSVIKQWLHVFLTRCITNQFKRTCMPSGPKVGTTAVSPRGDLRAPSDVSAYMWHDDIFSVQTQFQIESAVLATWRST